MKAVQVVGPLPTPTTARSPSAIRRRSTDNQSRLSAAIAASEVGFGGGPENLRFSANRQAEPGITPIARVGFCKVGLKGTVKYSFQLSAVSFQPQYLDPRGRF